MSVSKYYNREYMDICKKKGYPISPNADGSQKTPVAQEKYDALLNRPLPTYVFSVDINKGSMIFIPAFQSAVVDRVGGTHKVDFTDLGNLSDEMDKLRDDIIAYWHFFKLPVSKNTYKSSL